jgi:hypothetical protein
MSRPLSPAAQAVLDAFLRAPCDNELSVAATLRAAVYQTIRPDPLTGIDCIIYAKDLLAIAAELEADQWTSARFLALEMTKHEL